MDFNALWPRVRGGLGGCHRGAGADSRAAPRRAGAGGGLFPEGSDTFATVEKALADIAANTVAVAEQSERNFQAMLAEEADKSRARALAESTPKAFGVDEDLEAFLQGLTKEYSRRFRWMKNRFRSGRSFVVAAGGVAASVAPGTRRTRRKTRTSRTRLRAGS